jgi:hypothetical protein
MSEHTALQWALLFCAMSLPVCATSIALIVTPKFVVVAADSRSVDASGNIQPDVCKVRKAGKVFYIPNKFVGDSAVGYSLDKIVVEARGISVSDLAARVKAGVIEPLTAALEHGRSTAPAEFRQNFASGQAMGVTFLGFENGGPALVDLRFIIEDLSVAKLKLRTDEHRCPGADCPPRRATQSTRWPRFYSSLCKENPWNISPSAV